MGMETFWQWILNILVCALIFVRVEGVGVGITYLESAVAKGAVCLDGTAPAYHWDKGSGSGINNWMVLIEGGGWCQDIANCIDRKNCDRGSSKLMRKEFGFSGILGPQNRTNPDFFNWNRVKIRYCDGASFTGDVDAVDPINNVHFRGARIWRAIMDELLEKGMKIAENAILTGCSAGGLATILHCDDFRNHLPSTTKVKCVADAGYFIHGKDISGGSYVESFYESVTSLHGSVQNLPQYCTSKTNPPELCFFPQYVIPHMRTPIFIINAAYDSWQIKNIFAPGPVDKLREWDTCKFDFSTCSQQQLNTIHTYRHQVLNALRPVMENKQNGLFLDSCYAHCQAGGEDTWIVDRSPIIQNTTIAKAVGDWFYERNPSNKIDQCDYPCNPTCPDLDEKD